jgi:hypothetical protein
MMEFLVARLSISERGQNRAATGSFVRGNRMFFRPTALMPFERAA